MNQIKQNKLTLTGFKRWFTALILVSVLGLNAMAQVTVTNPGNTTPGLAATYTSLANAITALNAQTAISGPVTISLTAGNPQTAPSGGYAITAILTGASSTNTVTINGNGNTITAPNPAGTAGNLNDAIFKFIGSDFMTLQNFVMNENVLNTTTAAATNNMVEWGVALLYASTTNGAQNITIQNNTITLNRTYQNTFGIYSNATHSATSVTTSATATTAAGANSGTKIYGNTISNVNNGILIVGPTGTADANTGVDIGGTSALTGNTISNYGTTATFSGYANVSGTVYGVYVRNSTGFNISYNSISSSNAVSAGTIRAVFIQNASTGVTGTFTNNINNNTISLQGGAGVNVDGILVQGTTATATSSLNINNNNFTNFGFATTNTNAVTAISNVGSCLNYTASGNTFTNLSVNCSANFIFFNYNYSMPAGGSQTFNNNSVVSC